MVLLLGKQVKNSKLSKMLIEIKHLLSWTVNKSMQVKHRMSTKNITLPIILILMIRNFFEYTCFITIDLHNKILSPTRLFPHVVAE